MTKHVWSDEYTGKRYTYYSPYRPVMAHMLPHGTTIVIKLGQDRRTVVTTEPLVESYIKQADLELKAES